MPTTERAIPIKQSRRTKAMSGIIIKRIMANSKSLYITEPFVNSRVIICANLSNDVTCTVDHSHLEILHSVGHRDPPTANRTRSAHLLHRVQSAA